VSPDEQEPARSDERSSSPRRGSASGCFPLLLIVASVPVLAVGLLMYLSAEKASAAHSGVGGGLAGLGSITGILLVGIGVIGFILGAVLYVRSADD
jgi:hypothetical protein